MSAGVKVPAAVRSSWSSESTVAVGCAAAAEGGAGGA
eukprot:CAMPEP_0204366598 /NCGR_PEP_ID=MMETSP0469-20131031/42780_1 /ASSEMBLY_ACC=CAM_ASM_000384 /TAXON_ID=2969 /ORGANISM="Oxyrrhis marina" /LENGTH=36 /DNA_ID= /DNA_START= /DNA_END= /DNA_ORIENTATION=